LHEGGLLLEGPEEALRLVAFGGNVDPELLQGALHPAPPPAVHHPEPGAMVAVVVGKKTHDTRHTHTHNQINGVTYILI
jgi:hypothetical protein